MNIVMRMLDGIAWVKMIEVMEDSFIHCLFLYRKTQNTLKQEKKRKKKETQCYGFSCERLRKDQMSISGKKWRSH